MGRFLKLFIGKENPGLISFDDFLAFYDQKIDEHLNLEYQPRGAVVDAQDEILAAGDADEFVGYNAIAKSVAGFANSDGGLLVLGVKRKAEKLNGSIVKIGAGQLSMLPASVSGESIAKNLLARIQFPLENLTIVQLRKSEKSNLSVFLIDVPQSIKAPHRVNERYYFQRLGFSTYEMQHYQIADLFNRRLAPILKATVQAHLIRESQTPQFVVTVTLVNHGRYVAKHLTCICRVLSASAKCAWTGSTPYWRIHGDGKQCEFQGGVNNVLYPELSLRLKELNFSVAAGSKEPLVLSVAIYAEGAAAYHENFTFPQVRRNYELADKIEAPNPTRQHFPQERDIHQDLAN